jgi:succinylglutamate desuccinylase
MISDLIRRVAIVGGTHGNELTGVYLVKKFQQSPNLLKRLFDVTAFSISIWDKIGTVSKAG